MIIFDFHLCFFETQAELANLPNFPAKFGKNSAKIKNPLNVSKFKINFFISF